MSRLSGNTYPVTTDSKANDQIVIVRNGQLQKMTRGALKDYIEELAPGTLISLTDFPGSYVGQQGKALVVNSSEDAMEFQNATSGNFLALADTPSGYGGNATNLAVVNASETGLEFVPNALIALEDTPSSYAGSSEYLVRVNTAADGLEFVTAASEQTTGWAQYTDGTYTSGSPFSVTEGNTVDLPNDAATVIDSQLPNGVSSLYDGTVITPENDGDAYDVSIRFTTESSINEGTVRVAIDIGGTMGEIVSDFRRLGRGAGLANQCTIEFDVFSGSTFLANGGTVRFEAIDGDQNVYDINYFISRVHKAK